MDGDLKAIADTLQIDTDMIKDNEQSCIFFLNLFVVYLTEGNLI